MFSENEITQKKKIIITFSSPPTGISIVPTYYRYDKKFALSYGFDDGYLDAYQTALKLMAGGTVVHQDGNIPNYPGLFYTDGCGNNKNFVGTYNLNMNTIISSGTPSAFMSDNILLEAYVRGFELSSQGYMGRAVDYIGWSSDPVIKEQEILAEISQNYDALKNRIGVKFTNFTQPNNDNTYDPYVINLATQGILKVVGNINNALHYPAHQYTAEYWRDRLGLGISRDFLTWTNAAVTRTTSDFDVIDTKVTNVGTDHAWFTFATHRVNYGETATAPSTTLKFLSFKWLMEGLSSRYGATGNDTMWMATINDVYEYMISARDTIIKHVVVGNTLEITLDFSKIPSNFREHCLSFKLSTINNISGIAFQGFDTTSSKINHQGLGNNVALINVSYKPEYEKALMRRLSATLAIINLETSQSQADKDIVQVLVNALRNGSFKTGLQSRINAVTVIPDSVVMQIDFGRDLAGYTLTFPWNSFGNTTPGLVVGSKLTSLSTTTSLVKSISIEVIAPFSNYDANFPGTYNTLPFPYEACRDVLSVAANTTAILRLSGLNLSKKYDFSFYAYRGFVGNVTQYIIGGVTVSHAHKTNLYGTSDILNVVPSAGGTIDISIKGDGANIGYIGILKLIEHL